MRAASTSAEENLLLNTLYKAFDLCLEVANARPIEPTICFLVRLSHGLSPNSHQAERAVL